MAGQLGRAGSLVHQTEQKCAEDALAAGREAFRGLQLPNAERPIERRAYLPTFPEELRNAGQ